MSEEELSRIASGPRAVPRPQCPIHKDLFRRTTTAFISDEVHKAGFGRVVVGLSGGVDSAVSAMLAAEALGPQNVLAIKMPYRTSDPESLIHADAVIAEAGIESLQVDITPQIDAYFDRFPDASAMRRGNKMARERMTILYDHSARWQALVLGTSNKTELLLGYGTLHGDTASALNPLGDLYKTQVWALAEFIGVPSEIVHKQPSADLWRGQTDEEEMGFRYRDVDALLYLMIDRQFSHAELCEAGFDVKFIDRVAMMIRNSEFKRRMPLIARISDGTTAQEICGVRD